MSEPSGSPTGSPTGNETPAGHSDSADDSPLLFGQFLERQGFVASEAIDAALYEQQRRRVRMGELALKNHLLTESQVQQVLEHQTARATMFGQVAVELGLLTDEDVARLLQEQQELHVPLGEILIERNQLSRTLLHDCLDSFFSELTEPILRSESSLSR